MMECPHCHQEIPGKTCPACGAQVPQQSLYCMFCGASFNQERAGADDSGEEMDLENRILCPDGNCTGIIINGKCSECGKPYPPTSS